jgi:HAD superfamily hydrolase (TIGR01490 family)
MKASFFDIDGTLVKGLMIYEFAKHLANKGLIEKSFFEKMNSYVMLYLKNKMTYRKLAIIAPNLYAKGLRSVKVSIVKKEAKRFVDSYIKEFIHPYTMELVKLMKSYGMTIGISGSPIEVVSYTGKIFDFDLTYGGELEIRNGRYTGKIKQNLIIKEKKEEVLKKIIKENKIDLTKSFGFGDTEQDLSFLSKVKYPIALNPNLKLLEIFKKKGWPSFTSKDDVARNIKKSLKENIQ